MATATKDVCERAVSATLDMGDVGEDGEGRGVVEKVVEILLVVDEVVEEESMIPEPEGLVDVGVEGFTTVTVTRVGSVAMMVTVSAGVELVVIPDTTQAIIYACASLQSGYVCMKGSIKGSPAAAPQRASSEETRL